MGFCDHLHILREVEWKSQPNCEANCDSKPGQNDLKRGSSCMCDGLKWIQFCNNK